MMMSHAALPPIQIWPGFRVWTHSTANELTTTETRSIGIVSDVLS